MKKKTIVKPVVQLPVAPSSVVPPQLLETAKKAALDLRPKKTHRCRVCGAEGATDQSEGLCWVCRRLKISAWREVEQQMPMSE